MTTIPEARLEATEHGLVPRGEGWYVLNLADAAWREHDRFGASCGFEGDVKFLDHGINVHVLGPRLPNCHYHSENCQESFLVLEGECLLLVEGEERRLRAWDFVHCPAGTHHVFVGLDAPCAVLMVGRRMGPQERIHYPSHPVATKHGAASPEDTWDPSVSYAGLGRSRPARAPWPSRP